MTGTNRRGFTLIETTLYLGIFTLLLGGALPTAFVLLAEAGRTTRRAAASEDAAFIGAKIAEAVDASVSVDASSPTALVITADDGTRTFSASASVLTRAFNDGPPAPLHGRSNAVRDVSFSADTATVRASFAIDDMPFSFSFPLPLRGTFPPLCAQP